MKLLSKILSVIKSIYYIDREKLLLIIVNDNSKITPSLCSLLTILYSLINSNSFYKKLSELQRIACNLHKTLFLSFRYDLNTASTPQSLFLYTITTNFSVSAWRCF